MAVLQPWWRRRLWTQSLECTHLCTLLGKFRCEEQFGSAFFRFVLGPRVAAFLKPPFPDFAVAGATLECGATGPRGYVRFYDPSTVEFVHAVALPSQVKSVAYSPCGTRLAVVDTSCVVRLIEVDTFKMQELRLESRGSLGCVAVAFAPSGRYLVVALHNGAICSLDPVNLAEGGRVHVAHGIDFLAFSPSGDCLAVACFELKSSSELHFFEPNSLTELRSTNFLGSCAFVAYHPTGKSLAVGSHPDFKEYMIQLMDVVSLSVLRTLKIRVRDPRVCFGFSPDGRQLMVAHFSVEWWVDCYDSDTLEFLHFLDLCSSVRCFAFASASVNKQLCDLAGGDPEDVA